MEALPTPARELPETPTCFDLILGLSQSRDGRYSRNNVDGSASIDRVPPGISLGVVPTAPGNRPQADGGPARTPPSAVTPPQWREVDPQPLAWPGSRATRTTGTPIRTCVYRNTVGTGVALPRPHTKPPFTMGKEADGSDAHHPRAPHGSRPARRPPSATPRRPPGRAQRSARGTRRTRSRSHQLPDRHSALPHPTSSRHRGRPPHPS